MPEFKVQCQYYGERKNKFFWDKKEEIYHKFCVINSEDLPDKYFRSLWKGDLNNRDCWLWISRNMSQEAGINWEKEKDYCFVMNLGGEKTAAFNVKDFRSNFCPENTNSMVLKTQDYFENTVKKIGFWDSENYFYELNKKPKEPTKKPNNKTHRQNNPTKSENKNKWGKIALIGLSVIILFLFSFLIVKWASKRKKQK